MVDYKPNWQTFLIEGRDYVPYAWGAESWDNNEADTDYVISVEMAKIIALDDDNPNGEIYRFLTIREKEFNIDNEQPVSPLKVREFVVNDFVELAEQVEQPKNLM